MYLAYILFHFQPCPPITIKVIIERKIESIHLKSVHSGPKSKANISHDLCYVIGLYFASSCMRKLSTYFEYEKVLEYIGIISRHNSLDWVQSQMDRNTIYSFKSQTWNLALHLAYNRFKLTIQLLWCSNYIPYKTLYWFSSSMEPSQSTNYTLGKHWKYSKSK